MKILIDENIPCAFELFSHTGEVLFIPGRPLPISKLKNASGLMVRSVTNVNATLLAGTSVKFVGTATSGTDHIDNVSLEKAGIGFAAAPGCNAIAVVEYVFSALLLLAERDNFNLRDRTVGIVGVGNIGSCLYNRLKIWGVKTLLCDPIRAAIINCNQNDFYSLDELVAQVDIITLHTSLLKDGAYKSWHLVDSNILMALQPKTILINTCRGPVVDNSALLQALNLRSDLSVVLDVWEDEPNISLELLNKVDIGTAHIAGYTVEGKVRGTVQIFKAWCNFIGKSQLIEERLSLLPISELGIVMLNGILDQTILRKLVTLMYDIRQDDIMLRKFAIHSGGFDYLRKYYQERREWSSLQIVCNNSETASILKLLGFSARFKK